MGISLVAYDLLSHVYVVACSGHFCDILSLELPTVLLCYSVNTINLPTNLKYINTLFCLNRIGQETLMDENLADDDIETELAPITVQLAHVQQV